jgi:hypothetical protein
MRRKKEPTLQDLNFYLEILHLLKENILGEREELTKRLEGVIDDPMQVLVIQSQLDALKSRLASNARERDDIKIALIRYKKSHSTENLEVKSVFE